MKTIVIQSYRRENVPDWIARCMESVRAWAAGQGFDYQFADDSSFALCGEEYLARVGRNMRSITNLSRLELIKQAHGNGYDRAIWLDADVLVFHPALFTIEVTERYALAAETWLEALEGRTWQVTRGTNNCAIVCMRGEPDLDFLIAATRHIALNRRIETNFQVGGDLIKGLRASLNYATLDNIGMFSKHVVRGLITGDEKILSVQAIEHRSPVFAANLCAGDHYNYALTAGEAGKAVDALLSSSGNIVNRWLLRSPNNLRDGKPHVGMARLFSASENAALQFRQVHGRDPDFANPQGFNERIAQRKPLLTEPVYRDTADKLAVRDFVAARIGKDVLIPLFQTAGAAEDVDFAALPAAFVVKPTHASGWYEIVRDKRVLEVEALREKMRAWLRTNFYTIHFEAQYRDIPPRIMAEQLLLTPDGAVPPDYKFNVFGGRVGFIQVEADRFTVHKRSMFDRAWRRLNVDFVYPSAGDLAPPSRLAEMTAMAESLAADFDFARVDLYCVGDTIYFGEITHTPNAAIGRFNPPEFDAVLGRLWGAGEAIPERYFIGTTVTPQPPPPMPPKGREAGPAAPVGAPPFAGRHELNPRLLQFNGFSNFRLDATIGVNEVPKAGGQKVSIELGSARERQKGPTVSCLMATRDRFQQAQLAVNAYRRQTWRSRELVVLDSSHDDTLGRWIASLNDPTIRVIFMPGTSEPLGAIRNHTIDQARGTHIAQWDDDDLSHPARLEAQVAVIKETRTKVNLLSRELMWMPWQSRVSILQYRGHENTLLCERAAMPRYLELPKKEDTPLVRELIESSAVSYLDLPELYLYVAHGANTCDDQHMQMVWKASSYVFPDYTNVLGQLSRCFPIREYQKVLAVPAGAAAGA